MRYAAFLVLSTLLLGCATEVPGLIGATELKLSSELRTKLAAIANKAGPVQPTTTNAVLYSRARGNLGAVDTYDQRTQASRTLDGLKEEVRSIVPRSSRSAPEFERSLSLCGLVDLVSEASANPPRTEVTLLAAGNSVLPIATGGGLPSGGRILVLSLEIDHPSPCSSQVGDTIVMVKKGQLLRRVMGPIGTLQRLQDVEEKIRCTVGSGVNKDMPFMREDDLLEVACKHDSSIGWPIATTFAYVRSARQYLPLLAVRAEGTDVRFQYTSIR